MGKYVQTYIIKMKKITFLLSFILLCSFGFAQISHDLTIYSEDGLEFTLIANGQKVNDLPLTSVTLKNTENEYLNVKLVFKDEEIASLKRNNLQIGTPGQTSSYPTAVVYKIINKRGKNKVRFVSRTKKKIQKKETIIINSGESKPDLKIKVGDAEIEINK